MSTNVSFSKVNANHQGNILAKIFIEEYKIHNLTINKSIFIINSDFSVEDIRNSYYDYKGVNNNDIKITIELIYSLNYNDIKKIRTIINKLFKQNGIKVGDGRNHECDLDYLYSNNGDLENFFMMDMLSLDFHHKIKLNKIMKLIDFDLYNFIDISSLIFPLDNNNTPESDINETEDDVRFIKYSKFYINNKNNLDLLYDKNWKHNIHMINNNWRSNSLKYLIWVIDVHKTKNNLNILRGAISG